MYSDTHSLYIISKLRHSESVSILCYTEDEPLAAHFTLPVQVNSREHLLQQGVTLNLCETNGLDESSAQEIGHDFGLQIVSEVFILQSNVSNRSLRRLRTIMSYGTYILVTLGRDRNEIYTWSERCVRGILDTFHVARIPDTDREEERDPTARSDNLGDRLQGILLVTNSVKDEFD